MRLALAEEIWAEGHVSLLSGALRASVQFVIFPFLALMIIETCWDQTSHPKSLSNDEQSSPAELHRTCSVSEKQPPNLSVLIQ